MKPTTLGRAPVPDLIGDDPGIHAFGNPKKEDMDGRDEPGP
jgi:hypothetical protein